MNSRLVSHLPKSSWKSGRAASGQAQLAVLKHDAQARGLGLIARKAAELQKPAPTKT